MIKKLFKWFDKHKNEDSSLVQFLKLMYSIGQKSWIHTMISAILGIIIPILYEKDDYITFSMFIFFMILDIMFAYICNEYYQLSYLKRKFSQEISSDQSSLLKSILVELENNNYWKSKIFKTVSDLVCEKIYQIFKEVFKCETRVSVEYVFNKNTKTAQNVKHIKMSGRRSNKRSTVKKSVIFEKRKKYYSYKVFFNNNNGVNILDETKINNEKVWYKDPNHITNVKKYIGIAVSLSDDDKVKFILSIDFLDDFTFGENNSEEEIKQFIEDYLTAYINLISISYLLNLNNKKEIPEV